MSLCDIMCSNVLVYYNTNCNFVLLEDQGLPEEDFVKKNKKTNKKKHEYFKDRHFKD